MKTERKSPKSLLDAAIDERVDYFDKLTINHPIFEAVSKELLDAVLSNAEEPLILVVGPSRVGKSTLRRWLEKQLFTLFEALCKEDPNRMPFVSVEAIASGYGNFRWKDYYTRSLVAMKEPLIDKKVLYADEKGLSAYGTKGSTAALRSSMEKTLQYRKPLAFIVDEGQHLARVSEGRLEEQLDCIKSIANLTDVKHVLFGTYELLDFRNQSAQLNNRSSDIHFHRYDITIEEEKTAFINTIRTLQCYLPLKEIPDMTEHWLFLFERTAGCVGVLKRWLTRALRTALKGGSETIELEHLEKTAPSVDKAFEMAREVVAGEEVLVDNEDKKLKLSALLGLVVLLNNGSEGNNNNGNKKKRRPGKQNPRRYPVGKKRGSPGGGSRGEAA